MHGWRARSLSRAPALLRDTVVVPRCRPRLGLYVRSLSNAHSARVPEPPEVIPDPSLGSYVRGPLEPPLLHETLPSFFRTLLAEHADRPALVSIHEPSTIYGSSAFSQSSPDKFVRWTFAEFGQAIDALARGLMAMGVRKGDRVGAVLPNCSAYALLQWATARIGAIFVTLNPQYKPHELLAALYLTSPRALFITPFLRQAPFLSALAQAIPSLSSSRPHELSDPVLPSLRSLVIVDNIHDAQGFAKQMSKVRGASDMRDVMCWREDGWEMKHVQGSEETGHKDDVINLQFTSGTTGLPKAVSLTHHNLLNNGRYIGDCMKLTPEDRLCNVPPLFHCFGLVLGNLAAWTHASAVIYPSETFNPRAILDTVESERCTALHGVPTHFLGVLGEMEKGTKRWDTSTLRTGIAAGSPVPIELMNILIRKLNLVDLSIAYGMTETSPVSFQTTTTDPLVKRVETVGRVQPHAKAKVVDEHGEIVPIGVHGELCVAGYLVQKGYWDDPQQTKDVMQRHPGDPDTLWMMTGDVASMDEEGYLSIVGRIKDVIIRGGENLFPVQIENRLTANHSINEAAVVSVPCERYGEVPGAWIARHSGHPNMSRKEVRSWVADGMNRQNAPDWVWFLGEDGTAADLPKTASGKVMKHVLREWSRDLAAKGIGEAR